MTNRMTRIGAAVGAAVMTIGLSAAAFAGGDQQDAPGGRRGGPGGRIGGPGRGGPFGGPMGPLAGLPLRELNLTDAQREQVRLIMESHEAELKAIHDRIHAEVLQILTPEQQERAKAFSDSRPPRPNGQR